jgi:hypothetical protein
MSFRSPTFLASQSGRHQNRLDWCLPCPLCLALPARRLNLNSTSSCHEISETQRGQTHHRSTHVSASHPVWLAKVWQQRFMAATLSSLQCLPSKHSVVRQMLSVLSPALALPAIQSHPIREHHRYLRVPPWEIAAVPSSPEMSRRVRLR